MNRELQPPYKLDTDSTERIIKDLLIYKDAQLKVILKKYIDITAPQETLSEEKLQQLVTEFQKEIAVYEFQIAKAARQLEAQNFDREQNQELNKSIIEGIKQTDLEIENLKSVYQIEEQIKINRQHYENLSKQISSYENVDTVMKNIEAATINIEQLKIQHKQAAELIKIKEKQLFMMLHLMQDLIEVKYEL
ncbi:unnamed protein product (macronuclear) [Paramecium tetraurelia]|uniref:Uncharacterized protein n=1 Tax=Paramecium tetraurelia TaxID=5888 RepID=A0BIG2_PARTE|nr:uncharacterized protein GSPATT00004701001 [Paramecium tetraurelia]CAK58329.1 unnamed protein product [Paramecium tetraurelia]|eukprot:XP_001425727.1 hypothetical protein (macronuclear) [Paramecium tetraurelia strain d4-2]